MRRRAVAVGTRGAGRRRGSGRSVARSRPKARRVRRSGRPLRVPGARRLDARRRAFSRCRAAAAARPGVPRPGLPPACRTWRCGGCARPVRSLSSAIFSAALASAISRDFRLSARKYSDSAVRVSVGSSSVRPRRPRSTCSDASRRSAVARAMVASAALQMNARASSVRSISRRRISPICRSAAAARASSASIRWLKPCRSARCCACSSSTVSASRFRSAQASTRRASSLTSSVRTALNSPSPSASTPVRTLGILACLFGRAPQRALVVFKRLAPPLGLRQIVLQFAHAPFGLQGLFLQRAPAVAEATPLQGLLFELALERGDGLVAPLDLPGEQQARVFRRTAAFARAVERLAQVFRLGGQPLRLVLGVLQLVAQLVVGGRSFVQLARRDAPTTPALHRARAWRRGTAAPSRRGCLSARRDRRTCGGCRPATGAALRFRRCDALRFRPARFRLGWLVRLALRVRVAAVRRRRPARRLRRPSHDRRRSPARREAAWERRRRRLRAHDRKRARSLAHHPDFSAERYPPVSTSALPRDGTNVTRVMQQ